MHVGRRLAVVGAVVAGAVLLFSAIGVPYSQLRDATGTFRSALKDHGYPTATITKTRVDSGSGRSSKGYDARIKVRAGCLLHLQMKQPGLIGSGYSLVEVNGELLQLGGSPTYDAALASARKHGYSKCER